METNTAHLIVRLKEVKEQRRLTISDIQQAVEKAGEYISETTLRRVFAKDSEKDDSFSYDRTIMPIARAILFSSDVDDDAARAEIDGLKALVMLKHEQIQKMREQMDELRSGYEARISFLLAQIAKKDERMDRKDAIIERLMAKVL